VPHGEQRRRRAGGDAELRAVGSHIEHIYQDLDLPGREAGRVARPAGIPVAGCGEHGIDGVAVEPD
jgi:hypothetical protein